MPKTKVVEFFKNEFKNACIFQNLKTYPILLLCINIQCKSCKTLLTKFCHLIIIIGNTKQGFIYFLDLLNVLNELHKI